ncbi:(p)ppGpp synthetase [Duganella sp. FT109W]|uniref:(P)ppGpp synthetase n=1 Tax=Duganella margarita TaxID=2692170 RepID=A0ABW9WPR9_9BURK|nr:RelA/SpoT domain-containing protein [Duganella margarita]MYN42182.1 (p)ppGpp synthetase [Duganella margarita]
MYSGKQVIKAGEQLLIEDLKTSDPDTYFSAMDVLSYWRFSHEKPLDIAFTMLEGVAKQKDKSAIFAKRLKRYVSIVAKLRRFNQMKLKNMQDIGGCRAIVSNEKRLRQLVRELRKRPEFRTPSGKIRAKDYISEPKDDGYRGYHLIGNFPGDSADDLKSIEIQVRTALQHSWATALEIVDLFTGQALKSSSGDPKWKEFFALISGQFSIMESIHLFDTFNGRKKFESFSEAVISNDNNIEQCRATQSASNALAVISRFEAFAQSLKIFDQHLSESPFDGYALIEVDTKIRSVKFSHYSDDLVSLAEEAYIKAEKAVAESKNSVVALVSTTAIGGLKEAYPNYFGDSTSFVNYLYMVNKVALPPRKGSSWDNLVKRIFNIR